MKTKALRAMTARALATHATEGAVTALATTSIAAIGVVLLRSFIVSTPVLAEALWLTLGAALLAGAAGGVIGGLLAPTSGRSAGIGAMSMLTGLVVGQWAWTGWDGQLMDQMFRYGPLFTPARAVPFLKTIFGFALGGFGWRIVAAWLANTPLRTRLVLAGTPVALLLVMLGTGMAPGSDSNDGQHRVVLVGVDAANEEILADMMERTDLPSLEHVLENGVTSPLRPEPPFSPPSWTTLATGKMPEKHGVDNWDRNNRTTGKRQRYYLNAIRAKTIFEIADDNGMNAAVFEWPVVGRDTAGLDNVVNQASVHLLSFGHRLPFFFAAAANMRTPYHDRLYLVYRQNETGLIVLSHFIWQWLRPSILGIGVKSTDSAQHKYWGSLEPEAYGQVFDPDVLRAQADYIPSIYRIVDRIVGGFLDDPNADVIVFSDHGASGIPLDEPAPVYGGYKLRLNAFLEGWGYWTPTDDGQTDLARSSLYGCSDNSLNAQVCINITEARSQAEGKGPEQLLEEGRLVIEEASQRFASLYFEDDRTPLFPDEYGTPWNGVDIRNRYLDMAPGHPKEWFPNFDSFDLLLGNPFQVMSFDPGLLDRVISDGTHQWTLGQVLESKHNQGSHITMGILAAVGPSFAMQKNLPETRTSDIVPTALHLLGLPVGADMDGRVLVDALDPDSDAGSRTVTSIESHEPPGWERETGHEISNYERRMEQELKGLGYIN